MSKRDRDICAFLIHPVSGWILAYQKCTIGPCEKQGRKGKKYPSERNIAKMIFATNYLLSVNTPKMFTKGTLCFWHNVFPILFKGNSSIWYRGRGICLENKYGIVNDVNLIKPSTEDSQMRLYLTVLDNICGFYYSMESQGCCNTYNYFYIGKVNIEAKCVK